jgi:hypothetical protein
MKRAVDGGAPAIGRNLLKCYAFRLEFEFNGLPKARPLVGMVRAQHLAYDPRNCGSPGTQTANSGMDWSPGSRCG